VNSVRELRDGANWPPHLWISTGKGIKPHRQVSFLQVKEKRQLGRKGTARKIGRVMVGRTNDAHNLVGDEMWASGSDFDL
jgi:hypothetical protein